MKYDRHKRIRIFFLVAILGILGVVALLGLAIRRAPMSNTFGILKERPSGAGGNVGDSAVGPKGSTKAGPGREALEGGNLGGDRTTRQASGFMFEGTEFSITDPRGEIEWKIQVASIEGSSQEEIVEVLGMEATRFEGKRAILSIQAPKGRIDWRRGEISFQERVVAKAIDGELATLEAGGLSWNSEERRLVGKDGVRFKRGATEIRGQEVTCDPRLERVIIKGRARFTRAVVVRG